MHCLVRTIPFNLVSVKDNGFFFGENGNFAEFIKFGEFEKSIVYELWSISGSVTWLPSGKKFACHIGDYWIESTSLQLKIYQWYLHCSWLL